MELLLIDAFTSYGKWILPIGIIVVITINLKKTNKN